MTFEQVVQWINLPIVHIGTTPVTFGGIGSAVFIFITALLTSMILQRIIAVQIAKKLKLSAGITYTFQRIVHYSIVFFGIILAAQCVGLNFGALAVTFGFLGVGIGFGLQNLTANFISGLIILLERPIGVDDFVSIQNQVGTVVNISMRSTVIKTLDNVTIIVPNSKFIENQVTNWSYGDTRVRIHCPVGVAYGSDVELVKKALLSVVEQHAEILTTPQPEVYFTNFGSSSLDFELLVWTDMPQKQFLLQSKINYSIEQVFREAGIRIPFPQQDIHLQMTPAIEKLAKNI
ncbi:MAG: mechanosensitive ion channel [Candidatus Omnitrophica bacterium]|nr:mechanosensitive ion channel [Candidatus Omnitrophota bacterium]